MNDLQLGSVVRAVRRRRALSQAARAERCGISRGTVSLVERGHCDTLSLRAVRRVAAALEIRIDLQARWRGGELDRLLSRRHSRLGEGFAAFVMERPGWIVEPEVSFSIYGERGIVDLLCWHEATRHLLVIELKTEFVDVNELLGTLDRKRRLARLIATERGWRPATVSVWLVVEDTHTNRRHAAEHRTLLRAALPLDGRQLRPFLARPEKATAGIAFWPSANGHSNRPGPGAWPVAGRPGQ
jgi:transcriptional regulator with XRE-family HTH domain